MEEEDDVEEEVGLISSIDGITVVYTHALHWNLQSTMINHCDNIVAAAAQSVHLLIGPIYFANKCSSNCAFIGYSIYDKNNNP